MKKTLIALALAATLPLAANAQERSYSFVEGTYNKIDGSADGFGLRGSIAFGDSGFYGLGEYRNFSDRGIDLDTWELGAGYALNLGKSLDLIAEAAYADYDVVDGHRVSVGLRNSFGSNVEGLLKANYRDMSGRVLGNRISDNGFSGTAGLLVKFNPTWALSTEVEFDRGPEIYTVGVRASF
ncbi:hypothetical protein [Silanimonas lenta]|uniref:hypothetical protein n=1 Tax=Silanimonas lenta TaxID=265429 RepID=UPI002FE1EBC6